MTYLTAEQVADQVHASPRTVLRWTDTKTWGRDALPFIKPGKCKLFDELDVKKFIERLKVCGDLE